MRNDRERKFEREVPEYKEKLVAINRVAKVVKGGKNFRFTALMVVGNEDSGHVRMVFSVVAPSVAVSMGCKGTVFP